MAKARKLVGLDFYGSAIITGRSLSTNGNISIVAEGESALGTKLNGFCVNYEDNVSNMPGDGKLIDVVIGDPYLLEKVKVVARGQFGEIDVPSGVRKLFSNSSALEETEIIVFENQDGSLVYAEAWLTTLLENVIDEIDQELLPEHLREA